MAKRATKTKSSNKLIAAISNENPMTTTFNGALTNVTTGSKILDFYSVAGNRKVDVTKQFEDALQEDKGLAYRVSLWTRDVRGGAGERETFRILLRYMDKYYPDDVIAMLPKIPELGRWDDLLVLENPKVQKKAFAMIRDALEDRHGLCAKWMPRKGTKAEELRCFLGYTPKRYRKTLVSLSKTVEQQMCARQWDQINFDHVPSVASARYQKAFNKHCGEAYTAYKEGLKKVNPLTGKTERKINASAVFPYDVVKSLRNGDRAVATAQWEALPNFLGNNRILPVIDVSGSMDDWNFYGHQGRPGNDITVSPMDIAMSIGLYCATKQTGDFAKTFMTFSTTPELVSLGSGDLYKMLHTMRGSNVGGSTDIQASFKLLLDKAIKHKVPNSDMPKILLILSDMEFNACTTIDRYNPRLYEPRASKAEIQATAFDAMRQMYASAGYDLPIVVFWKINGRADNNPVKMHDSGAVLVSGFSPSVFKSILKTDMERYNPYNVMLDVLNNERYDVPGLTV